ncbi:hypothetical protein GBA52_003323 [Prunus armeniaca]|nr:hypothetical protein GBA52_003323 [Prunus armeniaca]
MILVGGLNYKDLVVYIDTKEGDGTIQACIRVSEMGHFSPKLQHLPNYPTATQQPLQKLISD